MLCCLGNYLDRKFAAIPRGTNIQGFLELLMLVVQSQSLVVSIPVLLTWTRLLGHRALGPAAADMPFIVNLLDLCSARLVRYENFPEDSEDPIYVLLIEDTDTIPERHAFLGNYRRYSCSIIESIVHYKLSEAFSHILRRAELALLHLYDGQPPLDREYQRFFCRIGLDELIVLAANYSRNSMPVLTVDAYATVIETALKGYDKWRIARDRTPEEVGWDARTSVTRTLTTGAETTDGDYRGVLREVVRSTVGHEVRGRLSRFLCAPALPLSNGPGPSHPEAHPTTARNILHPSSRFEPGLHAQGARVHPSHMAGPASRA